MISPAATAFGRLHDCIAAQADQKPDAPALACGDVALSYGQLIAEVDRAALALLNQGLGRGAHVGWLGLNSVEMLASLLACARLGAVWVPLNWRLAPAELAEIGRHAGINALLGTPEMGSLADSVRALLGDLPPPAPQAEDAADDLLLVYSSGTTGRPRGAVHTHRGMLANIDAAVAAQGLTAADRVLSALPLFHVGGLCIQTLPALAVGTAVRLLPRFEAGAWLAALREWRPTVSLLVPAAMRALLGHRDWPTTPLDSLRFVNSGSMVVPLALIEAFHQRGLAVTQVYGSTESGPVSIALSPNEALALPGRVGRPALGVQVRLVDATGTDVAPGQVGEIWLQAPNLLRTIHREPDHPDLVDGWLRTGDLGAQDAQGVYTVVGRLKDMLISGGENIYPAEIENLVEGFAGIAEFAVVGLPDPRWGEVPVLAVVAAAGSIPNLDALRLHLAQHLARYKQPREIVLRAGLPKTALGKVQKAALVAALAAEVSIQT